MEISSAIERMVLPGGSKLGKNEIHDPDTLKIYNTPVYLHLLLERLLYAQKVSFALGATLEQL